MSKIKMSAFSVLGRNVADVCEEAFNIGLTEKKKLKQAELFFRVNWIRGRYKKLLWEAYRCGVWSRLDRERELLLHERKQGEE